MVDVLVETTQGKLRGELRGNILMWKGIPYAASPVGPLRFRPPQPPARWAGERDATKFGATAMQIRNPRMTMISGVPEKYPSSEDCLSLNVFAPAEPCAAGRPVMMWVHGGAFVMGAGSSPLYNGASFAERGVIAVTINYRLGVPGLLYLGDAAPDREAGNCALLDQIAALRWIRNNIAAFGGDPGQVTVMGESAGAISIAALMAMPEAHGLFHRAILESGAAPIALPTRAEASEAAKTIIARLGVAVDQLADLPIDRLITAQEQHSLANGVGAFSPYVDGVSLPRPPIEAVRAGGAAGIPLLIGTNRDEWTLFEVFVGQVTIDGFKEPLRAAFGPLIDRLIAGYRELDPDHSEQRAWVDLIGDFVFRIPVLRHAEAQAGHGTPVYVYRFDWAAPTFGGKLGATHALELPFVWNKLDLPTTPILLGTDRPALQRLATQIHETWVAFIKSGDPNGGGLPAWPRYDAQRRATMVINTESKVVDDVGGATRKLWPPM